MNCLISNYWCNLMLSVFKIIYFMVAHYGTDELIVKDLDAHSGSQFKSLLLQYQISPTKFGYMEWLK